MVGWQLRRYQGEDCRQRVDDTPRPSWVGGAGEGRRQTGGGEGCTTGSFAAGGRIKYAILANESLPLPAARLTHKPWHQMFL